MNTTIKGLSPDVTYTAHLYARARTWADMHQPCPFAPLASGDADADGNLTLDLPVRTEVGLMDPTGRLIQINNATTTVVSA